MAFLVGFKRKLKTKCQFRGICQTAQTYTLTYEKKNS